MNDALNEYVTLEGGPAAGSVESVPPGCNTYNVPFLLRAGPVCPPDWPVRLRADDTYANVTHLEFRDPVTGEWVDSTPHVRCAAYRRTGGLDAEGRAVFAWEG